MKNFWEKLPYFILFILFLESFGAGNSNFFIMLMTYSALFLSVCIGGILSYKSGKTDNIFLLLIALSFSLGLLYIYNTPFGARQHDTGGLVPWGRGHLHYISWLLEKHTLPFFHQSPALPIEHPPLYYIIAAFFVKCISLIRGIDCVSLTYGTPSHDFLCESLQYLTLFFVSGTMYLFYLILKLFKLPFVYGLLAFILISFYPIFIILSGSLNNDSASLFFGTLSMLLFMRYILSNKTWILCLSAFLTALTLLIKVSGIFLVMGVGLFLFFAWIKKYYSFKKAFGVGMIYALISLPIGLSWSTYNYFKWDITPTNSSHLYTGPHFNKESGYHPILHTTSTHDDQNISDYSYFDRLLIVIEPERYPFIRTQKPYEYNIWSALIKSSLFDEYTFFPKDGDSSAKRTGYTFSLILFYLNSVFLLFFLWAFFTTKNNPLLLYLKCISFFLLTTFIMYCFIHPRWSAALARYIPNLFLCMALINFKYVSQLSLSYPKEQKFIFLSALFYTLSFVALTNILFMLYFICWH